MHTVDLPFPLDDYQTSSCPVGADTSPQPARVNIATRSLVSHFNRSDYVASSATLVPTANIDVLPQENVLFRQKGFKSHNIHTTLTVTNHRLIVSLDNAERSVRYYPLFSIDRLRRIDGPDVSFLVVFKDWRVLRLGAYEPSHACGAFFVRLQELLSTFSPLPFLFLRGGSGRGWGVYDVRREFVRLRLEDRWRVCDYNKTYDICPSYPALLVVPHAVGVQRLRNSAEFRAGRRLPVLTWAHPVSRCALLRSSQPRTGLANRCDDDISLLYDECNQTFIKIYDCRPYFSALGNLAFKNAGYELPSDYSFSTMNWLDIPNIHAVREALEQCYDVFTAHPASATAVFKTRWLQFIALIIQSSLMIAKELSICSVLVHCSDGWDRTSQVCGLAQLVLDPYYRTIEGFAVLVEKDWLSFGHQFAARTGATHDAENTSPVFLQFLHCAHVILKQHPRAFEFTDALLRFLADELVALEYGTFAFNNERERVEQRATSTRSVWDDVLGNAAFLNPTFAPCSTPLPVNTRLLCISPWTELFLRYSNPEISRINLY